MYMFAYHPVQASLCRSDSEQHEGRATARQHNAILSVPVSPSRGTPTTAQWQEGRGFLVHGEGGQASIGAAGPRNYSPTTLMFAHWRE